MGLAEEIGKFSIIEPDVTFGKNVRIGNFVRIMPGTIIGDNTVIMDYVKLMPKTVIGNDCKIDDYVNTSGYVKIGNNIRIKRCSMIGQAVEIEDGAWIGSCVTTTRIRYPKVVGEEEEHEEWIKIGKSAMVGSRALLLAGITIGEGAVIGAGAIVTKNCVPFGVYVGCPAKLVRMREDR